MVFLIKTSHIFTTGSLNSRLCIRPDKELSVFPANQGGRGFVSTDLLRNWSSLFSEYFTSWAISFNVDTHAFRFSALAAVPVWGPVIVASRFTIVGKYRLLVTGARSGLPFSFMSLIGRDLFNRGCWSEFFAFRDRNDETGCAEKYSILSESTGQF